MARYTPEFLAALRQRYEKTDYPMRALALEFGIGISTLSAIVEREGWIKRSQRQRGQVEAPLLSEAQALLASLPERGGAVDVGAGLVLNSLASPPPVPARPSAARGQDGEQTAAERLEALVLMEIAAEEAARAELGTLPRLRAEADACARRLATLTQTLQTLQKIRDARPANDMCRHCADDLPEDIDAFREHLARRIEAFMESRTDEEFEPYLSETQAKRDAEGQKL